MFWRQKIPSSHLFLSIKDSVGPKPKGSYLSSLPNLRLNMQHPQLLYPWVVLMIQYLHRHSLEKTSSHLTITITCSWGFRKHSNLHKAEFKWNLNILKMYFKWWTKSCFHNHTEASNKSFSHCLVQMWLWMSKWEVKRALNDEASPRCSQ